MARAAVQSNVLAAQQKKLSPELELPVGEAAPVAPSAPTPPANAAWLDAMIAEQAEPVAPEIAGLDQGIQETQAIEQEVARQAIPSLRERAQQPVEQQRWLKPVSTINSQQPDGGLRGRAKAMADNTMTGAVVPNLVQDGAIMSAVEKSGAITQNADGYNVPAPEYIQVASAVVENNLASGFFNEGSAQDAEAEAVEQLKDVEKKPAEIPATQGNAALGQNIHQEFQRMQGTTVPDKLPREEAEVLGAAFKDMWAMNNPEYVTRTPDPKTGLHMYQLTSAGEVALRAGTEDRARLFPPKHVRPAKTVLPTGDLPGDVGENVVRKVAGHSVGKPKFGREIEEARKNLAAVPNVVDRQRAKILYSTILPVLASGDYSSWQAEINNIGPSKLQAYQAGAEDKVRGGEIQPGQEAEYVQSIMNSLTDKIAQEVRAIAQERNGANYLSYSVQGFNGRLTPQQSFFNPTTSKAVRFVTRNAVPAIAKPGSRIEKNLRQMYAMMLVKGADIALPQERERMLTAASGQLEAWGDALAQSLTMTDEQYEAVSQAIAEGRPLNDPAYQAVQPMQIDDPALVAAIESKGEDGPHFIDGLIDFAKYQKAKRAGRPHNSFFNAYIDGKTNGLASNGIQMGHIPTAYSTGTLRQSRKDLLDAGDIRDQLKDNVVESIYGNGWEGDVSAYESELNHVAGELMKNKPIGRNLHKKVTMTFGYGKEIGSFIPDIEAAIGEMAVADPTYRSALAEVEKNLSRTDLAKKILDDHYGSAVVSAMSDEAMEARDLMRGAAALHAATNQLFSIKGPTGMDINLGRDVSKDYGEAEQTKYSIYADGQRQNRVVAHRATEATSAAAKSDVDEEGNVRYTPGEVAYGGSVVAPVQALDAATVAKTASGKSWKRLSDNSAGNPYLHSIYDAFKMDAMGYDVIMEEVNDNWLSAGMNWNYLQATYDSTLKAMTEFQKDLAGRKADEQLSTNERAYMDWFLAETDTPWGARNLGHLRSKLPKFKNMDRSMLNQAEERFKKGMAQVGYNVSNPPANPTVGQLRQFTKILAAELDLRGRLSKAIAKTNDNKKKLKAEILRGSYKTPSGKRISLQYYAH